LTTAGLYYDIILSVVLISFLADRTYVMVDGAVVVRPSSVCSESIVAKRYEIGPRLLLITNRKSHIGFQMT